MRISATKVVQLVESANTSRFVILDETTGVELALTPDETMNVAVVIDYFRKVLLQSINVLEEPLPSLHRPTKSAVKPNQKTILS